MRRLICSAKLWGILPCLLLSLSPFSLRAAPIDCMGAFPCAIGRGWIVFVTPNGNDVNLKNINSVADPDFPNSAFDFTLDKVVTFNNLNSVTIEFLGPELPNPQTQDFFLVTEKITNKSNQTTTKDDWKGFMFDINDQNPIEPDGTTHPDKAHFHFQAFTNTDKLQAPQVPNNKGTYTGTASAPQIVKNGDTWNASILKMHDFVDEIPPNSGQFLRMDFKLVETPIAAAAPEPGTLALFGIALAGLAWRRRKT